MKLLVRLILGCCTMGTLAACAGMSLNKANDAFVQTLRAEGEVKELVSSGTVSDEAAEMAYESVRSAYLQNGQDATKAATKAKKPRMRASFLNVAARNFYKAGTEGWKLIDGVVQDGEDICKKLSGEARPPATCNYFGVVTSQYRIDSEVAKLNAAAKTGVSYTTIEEADLIFVPGEDEPLCGTRSFSDLPPLVGSSTNEERSAVQFEEARRRFCNLLAPTRDLLCRVKQGDPQSCRAIDPFELDGLSESFLTYTGVQIHAGYCSAKRAHGVMALRVDQVDCEVSSSGNHPFCRADSQLTDIFGRMNRYRTTLGIAAIPGAVQCPGTATGPATPATLRQLW